MREFLRVLKYAAYDRDAVGGGKWPQKMTVDLVSITMNDTRVQSSDYLSDLEGVKLHVETAPL